MKKYLRSTEVIDCGNPYVLAKAKKLAEGTDDTLIIVRGSGNNYFYRLLDVLPLSVRLYFLDILERDREGFVLDSKKYFINEVYYPDSYKYFVISLYSKRKHSAIGKPWIIENFR